MGHLGDWVEVATARDLLHAHILLGLLAEEGIEVRVGNAYLQGALGDIPMGYATSPKLLVRRADVARAVEVLQRPKPLAGPTEPGSNDQDEG